MNWFHHEHTDCPIATIVSMGIVAPSLLADLSVIIGNTVEILSFLLQCGSWTGFPKSILHDAYLKFLIRSLKLVFYLII